MPYQDPYSGQWFGDDGIPLDQSGAGQPGSYLPGYMPNGGADGSPYTSPVSGQPAISSWPDYQSGYTPPPAAATGGAPAPVGGDPSTTPPTTTGSTGTGTTGGTTGAGGTSPFAFDPTTFQWPLFQAPPAFTYDPFKAPTAEDAANEPGYAFARDQGVKALENSAAAKGTLRTGGTLKDIIGWGDKFAQQQYGSVYDRAANTYQMNRGNASDIWSKGYTSALDSFLPKQTAARDVFGALVQQWRDALNSTTQIASSGAGL